MPRPPSPSIPEKEFLFTTLKQNLRLDGRLPLQMREPTLTFGPELGWVEVAMGKTRYEGICRIVWDRLTSVLQSACAGGRQDGEANTRTAARRHHHNTLGNLAYGIK